MVQNILISFIALEHLYILYFEMFKWETIGKRTFTNLDESLFNPTKGMAANQGLYNGFLSAGLIWTLFICDKVWADNIAIFFLSCVIIAGTYGAVTVTKKIFLIQAFPAIVTLIFILISK